MAANTTSRRPGAEPTGSGAPPSLGVAPLASEAPSRGGLSGPPLKANAVGLVRDLYEKTGGAVPIIGVGGVASPEDAYALIRAGATLVQLYTALVYRGPSLAPSLRDGLADLAAADGFAKVQDAVGADRAAAAPAARRAWFWSKA